MKIFSLEITLLKIFKIDSKKFYKRKIRIYNAIIIKIPKIMRKFLLFRLEALATSTYENESKIIQNHSNIASITLSPPIFIRYNHYTIFLF